MECLKCLKLVLKVINYVLLVAGLGLLCFDIYMFIGWHNADGGSLAHIPWFIATITGVALFVCLTAIVGISGADCGCCVNLYMFMAVLLLLAEIAVVVAVYVRDVHIPSDTSGNLEKLTKFMERNIHIVRAGCIGALIIQSIALFTACMISLKENKDSDDDEDFHTFINPVYSRLQSNEHRLLNTQKTDAWSRRMRQKYHLDTSKFSYDPEHQRLVQDKDDDLVVPRNRKCSLM
eukprot:TRINITY_DN34034_c0_g1_i5.p1 TRINITY_DN34034_c0_g1~~TRINITY_DN34034_c0_g1_i5.p1  ORF type:complete len:245 (-),score=25.04 TRINITY_DN34034_c0_g1_i5:484-1185(-)